ncbi:hypothetical protein [Nonomuraea indica]|uniref:Uncharacterized protein n=1 Tax=Nonomuraea indica TaxID=1581193 RepID=A0ABW8ACB3_9ACTN|nr:hypothetical protein [Nonomuraea indica]
MTDIKSIVLPIVIILIMAGGIAACVALYFRFERRRAEALAAELAGYRELAERAAQRQEEAHARIADLAERVAAVERLLRSVG